MDDLEYLNKISQTNRPVEKEGGIKGFLKSKIFKLIVAGIGLLIFIILIGSLLGQLSNRGKDSLIRVNSRMTGLSSIISEYNSSVKSSKLRAMGVSLAGSINQTSKQVYDILLNEYKYNEESDSEVTREEAIRTANIDATLEKAKMNGILDRTYLHQLVYEVSSLISLELGALERAKDESTKQILQESIEGLTILQEQLAGYSDSTN